MVESLLDPQNRLSVEHHRQVAASLEALELGPAAYLAADRKLVVSAVPLLRQRQVCKLVLQLKVDLVVVVSSEVEPQQVASSAVHQPLRHLEEPQHQEAVSLAAVPPKLKEDPYLADNQPKHRHSEAKHTEQES